MRLDPSTVGRRYARGSGPVSVAAHGANQCDIKETRLDVPAARAAIQSGARTVSGKPANSLMVCSSVLVTTLSMHSATSSSQALVRSR